MTPKFNLVLALVFLFGAAAILWLRPADAPPIADGPTPRSQHYVFAMSWQPGFCETAMQKPECRAQSPGGFDATNFTLHGLWPDALYCGVADATIASDKAGRWRDLPAINLDAAARAALNEAMPGTQSALERHEWIKHGTCSGANAEGYFATALEILSTINASNVRSLFAGAVGATLRQSEIRAAFDQAFGPGAGARVRVACASDGNRRLITELTLGLAGNLAENGALGSYILAAPTTDGGCDSGIVDAVGNQ